MLRMFPRSQDVHEGCSLGLGFEYAAVSGMGSLLSSVFLGAPKNKFMTVILWYIGSLQNVIICGIEHANAPNRGAQLEGQFCK